ncbi:MAG TPA: hypothetical protein VFJ16_00795 [Longimicrobium sp.]|nr:hypothetical protein [Longimicrobium sp.]
MSSIAFITRLNPVARACLALLLLTGAIPGAVSGQMQYSTTDGDVRPAACRGTEEFYSFNAYPYFNNDDYFFVANPFILAKRTSLSTGIYRSTMGYSLVDVTGRKIWRDAGLAVSCYEFTVLEITVRYSNVDAKLGMLVDRTIACNDSGPNTDYASLQYDPYSESGEPPSDCPDGSGSGGGDTEGGGCRIEFFVVEISYDGGASWHTLWEGYGWVC